MHHDYLTSRLYKTLKGEELGAEELNNVFSISSTDSFSALLFKLAIVRGLRDIIGDHPSSDLALGFVIEPNLLFTGEMGTLEPKPYHKTPFNMEFSKANTLRFTRETHVRLGVESSSTGEGRGSRPPERDLVQHFNHGGISRHQVQQISNHFLNSAP